MGPPGPVAFGMVVDASGYETAWRLAAVLFLLAAALVIVARRMFIADLVARPPRQAIRFGGGRETPTQVTEPRTPAMAIGPTIARYPGSDVASVRLTQPVGPP